MFWNYSENQERIRVAKMNLKHEMFWNVIVSPVSINALAMNLKHEMFWNMSADELEKFLTLWTLNMKCFEI